MKFCAYCGTENQDNARFCEKCGVPLVEKPEITQPAYTEVQLGANTGKKKHKSALIGILTLLLLCGVAATIGFFIIRSQQGYRQTVQQLENCVNGKEDSHWKYEELVCTSFEVETQQECERILKSEGENRGYFVDFVLDEMEKKYGDDWKVEIRILDVSPMLKQAIDKENELIQSYAEQAEEKAEKLSDDCMFWDYTLSPSNAKKLAEVFEDEVKQYKKTKVTDGKTLTIQYRIYADDEWYIHSECIGIYLVNDKWIFRDEPEVLERMYYDFCQFE